jgi:aldose 1-epimerase
MSEFFTLKNGGLTGKFTAYGATLMELHVPDRQGKLANVVLGFDNLADYQRKENPHFGGTIGRYANRIANGEFRLNGISYVLPKNDKLRNCLHSGPRGFDHCEWDAEAIDTIIGPAIKFTRLSADGENGFPGNVQVSVLYTLSNDGSLCIEYSATTDKATPINLTNHAYFNLSGAGSGDVLHHELTISAQQYTPVDEWLIPTGEIRSVEGTPLDFTTKHTIGERINELPHGYDHNLVLSMAPRNLAPVATLHDPASGRTMDVLTTEPAVQLYTAYWLDGTLTGNGGTYHRYGAVCLETQHFPDSPNHPQFPNTILRPAERFASTTVYRFTD